MLYVKTIWSWKKPVVKVKGNKVDAAQEKKDVKRLKGTRRVQQQ